MGKYYSLSESIPGNVVQIIGLIENEPIKFPHLGGAKNANMLEPGNREGALPKIQKPGNPRTYRSILVPPKYLVP